MNEAEKEAVANLDSFAGFDTPSEDFFTPGADTPLQKALEDNLETKEKVVDPSIITAENHDFSFGDPVDEEEEEVIVNTEEEKVKKVKATTVNTKSTLDFLKEKGFVDYELPEGKTELTEDEAESLLEDSWEGSIDNALKEMMAELPQGIKDIITVATKGGDTDTLIKKLAKAGSIGLNKNSDMTQEANQVLAVKMELSSLGWEEEEIASHIDALKSTEKLEGIANKAFKKITESQEALSVEAAKQATAQRENNKKSQREYKNNLSTFLGSAKEIEGITVSKQDIASLPAYISDPTIELDNGSFISELQHDIFSLMKDKESLYLLSKAMKGKKGKLDFSFLVNKKITAETQKVKDSIQNTETDKTTRSSGSSQSKRSFSDHF